MKKIIVTSIALAMSASVGAQSLDIANDRPVVASPVVAQLTLSPVVAQLTLSPVVAQVTPVPLPIFVSTAMPTFFMKNSKQKM